MSTDFNPFTEQIDVKYFVGREHLLNQFKADLSGLRSGTPNHQYVAGLEGTGKTSYLAKLVEIATAEGFLAVMPTLDAEALSRGHISTVLRSLAAGLQDRLKSQGAPRILDDWESGKESRYFYHPRSDDLKNDRIRQDFEKLADFMSEASIPGAVVCIDEGQRIDGRAMSALKNALQFLKRYLIVLSLRLITDEGGAEKAGRSILETKATKEAEGDIGASRFYVTAVPIGPFDSDQEAIDCIKRRLCDNVVQFNDEVVRRIGDIAARLPKNMILLSNNLYNDAKKNTVTAVETALLNHTFRRLYYKECGEAVGLLDGSPATTKIAIRGLLEVAQPTTAAIVAGHLYPGANKDALGPIAESIQHSLESLSKTSTFIVKTEEQFTIPRPVQGYALGLALGIR